MATYSVNVTASTSYFPDNLSGSQVTVFAVTNSLAGASYFGLETVPPFGWYYSGSTPSISGSFSYNSGIIDLIKDDYKMLAVVKPGGGTITFTPAVSVTGSNLLTRGTGGSVLGDLLLDRYVGAAAAYSLRQLSTTYEGPAIRVRRSSDNAEQDIGFTSGGLDTTTLTSFCGSGDGFVTTWYDQSGNSNNAAQTTAANQPQIVSSGAIITDNGKPALLLDGSNDKFITNSDINSLNMTIVPILNRDSSNIYTGLFHENGALGGFMQYPTNGGWIYRTSTYNGLVGIPPAPDNQQIQLFLNVSSTQINGYYNNIAGSVGVSITNPGYSLRVMFAEWAGGPPFRGKTQEFICYSSNQMSNRLGIQSNQNSYYGIY